MKPLSSQTDLKQAVNKKLDEHELSSKQLYNLHGLLNNQQTNKNTIKQRPWYLVVATAMVAVMAVFLITTSPNKSVEMPQLIAGEVVRNHLKLKPLEVSTDSLIDIRKYFNKLKFSPIASLNINDTSTLIGGRYCSLQGYKAAQLRIASMKSGNVDTVYQAPYIRDTFGELPDIGQNDMPIVVYERGIKVSIWVEKDILFARTHVDSEE